MDNINDYIISQLKRPVTQPEICSIYNIIEMMPDEELSSLYVAVSNLMENKPTYDWHAIDQVLRKIRRTRWENEGGNKSISELLQLYKEHGDTMAADQICDSFEHLSFQDQKRILKALICTDYILWLYPYFNDTWGKLLVNELKQNYIECDSDIGLEYVIKYADEKFIWEHLDDLSSYDYLLVAMRLGNHPDFTIDAKKFRNKWEHYRVLDAIRHKANGEYMLQELFRDITDVILTPENSYHIIEYETEYVSDVNTSISVRLIRDICAALNAMQEMGLKKELLYFYKWDLEVRAKLKAALAEVCRKTEVSPVLNDIWVMYCKIAEQNFPDHLRWLLWKHPGAERRCEEMVEELQPMIERLGLEVESVEIGLRFPGERHSYACKEDAPF